MTSAMCLSMCYSKFNLKSKIKTLSLSAIPIYICNRELACFGSLLVSQQLNSLVTNVDLCNCIRYRSDSGILC